MNGDGLEHFAEETEPEPSIGLVQYRIAGWLLALLAGVSAVILGFALMNPDQNDAVNGLLTGLFSPILAVASGATGFYFGAGPGEESAEES
jgi:hypothetical protein